MGVLIVGGDEGIDLPTQLAWRGEAGTCQGPAGQDGEPDLGRLEVLLRVQSGRLRVSDAYALIGLQRRQVFRLLRGLKQDGAPSCFPNTGASPATSATR